MSDNDRDFHLVTPDERVARARPHFVACPYDCGRVAVLTEDTPDDLADAYCSIADHIRETHR